MLKKSDIKQSICKNNLRFYWDNYTNYGDNILNDPKSNQYTLGNYFLSATKPS